MGVVSDKPNINRSRPKVLVYLRSTGIQDMLLVYLRSTGIQDLLLVYLRSTGIQVIGIP